MIEELESLLPTLGKIWNMVLYSSDGNVVRLNQVIIAISIIIIGVFVSKILASQITMKVQRWGKLGTNAAHVLKKCIHLVFIVVIVLIALPIAGIPVTIFTVLGGGIAIGIGFGAQNLFNNLISGMIIMAERPIRIGDVIEIDGLRGKVIEINNRCIRMKKADGIDVLIPNSHFLEKSFENWTLCDNDIRCCVAIGVAYGSPTQKVRELLLTLANENKDIYKSPEPYVLFNSFGESSLDFELHFWSEVKTPRERSLIESEVRFQIDETFRKHSIEIAFPQRDIHIRTDLTKPHTIA